MPAAESQTGKQVVEFGPFRIDPEKQLLFRDGELIALTPKAFQLLLVLVRRSNQTVSKDDLMKAVWPDTFVEETNLTRNIFTLRRVLGETELDRYIVTVPGQGYRLAVDARLVSDAEATMITANHARVQVQVEETQHWRWVGVAAILLLALGAYAAWHFSTRRPPALGEKDTVVLADFVNSTGDPVFDDTLRQGMVVELEQSPFLSLVSEERIRHILSLMGENPNARLTPDIARQVCERLGGGVVIHGAIARMGTRYVLSLHAANCNNSAALDDEQVLVARKEDILNALTEIARRFRSRAGESLAAIQQHTTPLAEATTPSLEALKAYSAAWKVAFSSPHDAILLLQHATEIDPEFAMAWASEGRFYADIWEPVLAQQSARRAYELRDRASDWERFFIEMNYDEQVTGNIQKARDDAELWAQTYPRDPRPHGMLTWTAQELGNYDDSIREAQESIKLDPDFAPGYINLAWTYVLLGQPNEGEAVLQRASDRKLDMPEMLVMRYYISWLKGDQAGMEEAVAQSRGRFGAEDWMAYAQASALAFSGHMKQARETWSRAAALARQANQPERAAMYEAGAAVREAFFENHTESKRDASAALALSHDRDVVWGAALALALSGDIPRSQAMAHDLQQRFPEDSYVRFTYLPMLAALAALHDSDPAKALQLLQAAAPYDLGVPGSWSGFFGNLYPVYLRGLAYLSNGEPAQAAAEFRKVLDHPGIVFTDPVGVTAQFQLARAYALEKKNVQARVTYEAALHKLKSADPDIPIFHKAREEYAKLK